MFSFLLWLFLGLTPAHAQNTTCATRAAGDSSNACASTAFVNGGSSPAIGHFTPNLPLIGGPTGYFAQGTRSGNTTGFLTFSGSLTNGDCLSVNSGNAIDAGGPCSIGTGGGTVSAGLANQLAYYAVNGTTVTGTFDPNFPATGNWYADLGANIQRWNDRTLIGGATALDGNQTPTSLDWLSVQSNAGGDGYWPSLYTELLVETQDNNAGGSGISAIVGAAQTLHATSLVNAASQGVSGICYNNNTSFAGLCWGIYAEAHRMNNTVNDVYGAEFDVRQLGSETIMTPFSKPPGQTIGNWIGCGAGKTTPGNPCSAAIGITPNTEPFDAGIIFRTNSIRQVSSQIQAIEMPESYEITWYNSSNDLIASIYADGNGIVNINSANGVILNGSQGVSCSSGISLTSFRSVGGIVTHC